MAHSSSGLGHIPLKAEIRGSNPLCATPRGPARAGPFFCHRRGGLRPMMPPHAGPFHIWRAPGRPPRRRRRPLPLSAVHVPPPPGASTWPTRCAPLDPGECRWRSLTSAFSIRGGLALPGAERLSRVDRRLPRPLLHRARRGHAGLPARAPAAGHLAHHAGRGGPLPPGGCRYTRDGHLHDGGGGRPAGARALPASTSRACCGKKRAGIAAICTRTPIIATGRTRWPRWPRSTGAGGWTSGR